MEAQQVSIQVQMLAERLSMTKYDEQEAEEYVLTPEEEKQIWLHAIEREKELFRFRHLNLGEKLESITVKMADVNWEEVIDKKELFATCNSSKLNRIWEQGQREREKQQEEVKAQALRDRYTANFVFSRMKCICFQTKGVPLIVNDDTKHLITTICFYISKDKRFETELGYSFNKGLLVRGISGLGKTFLFECVKDNEINPIAIYSMIEIWKSVRDEGEFNFPLQDALKSIYLDDVGTEEPVVNYFGTKINFFKNFIETYYLNKKTYEKLIISTNNSFDEIENKYGFRVRSRMKDMFNIVDVTGKDLRG